MATKKTTAVRNPATGSYTVRVPKDATTGRFVTETKATGRIVVQGSNSKTR